MDVISNDFDFMGNFTERNDDKLGWWWRRKKSDFMFCGLWFNLFMFSATAAVVQNRVFCGAFFSINKLRDPKSISVDKWPSFYISYPQMFVDFNTHKRSFIFRIWVKDEMKTNWRGNLFKEVFLVRFNGTTFSWNFHTLWLAPQASGSIFYLSSV